MKTNPCIQSEVSATDKNCKLKGKVTVNVFRNNTIFDAGDVARLCAAISLCAREYELFRQEEPKEYNYVLLNNRKGNNCLTVNRIHWVPLVQVASCPDMSLDWWNCGNSSIRNKVVKGTSNLILRSTSELMARSIDNTNPKRPLFYLTDREMAYLVGVLYYHIAKNVEHRFYDATFDDSKVPFCRGILDLFKESNQLENELDPMHPAIAPLLVQIEKMLHPHPLRLRFSLKPHNFSVSRERECLQRDEINIEARKKKVRLARCKIYNLLSNDTSGIRYPSVQNEYKEVLKTVRQAHDLLQSVERQLGLLAIASHDKRLEIK